ncbi:DNA repair protein RadA/Sms [Thermosyntropha lipolytica DSM 11003]|uniref:DNA repair protein RadA n=1 Tax=Thermosyntropha lipolytica DSM 11003 TaxID=1123382 RepID=A0A1M5NRT3_9FIRM|nr:DNA repair protein RadA [Thermosyntropha lipolytica]SHG92252.1 DNA repair protein RadA/Sms [Thermosyntropha lipolytica DSM 11003]
MGKNVIKFVCGECGYESGKWLGRCPACNSWNTLQEERIDNKPRITGELKGRAVALSHIENERVERFSTGIGELDRVLGGGIVPGSLILLGGDPGIGKSTLLLQVADHIAGKGEKVLYLSGEESFKQIRLRSLRLGINNENIYLLNEQNIDFLGDFVQKIKPRLVIIDSIQTVYSGNLSSIPGSVSQLKECTARITELAKASDISVFLVGHVTKEGAIAGPKILEHMVDVVVYFEGEKNFAFRLLRGIKNRFGATDELGILEMTGQGLLEVKDPSQYFLDTEAKNVSGTAVAVSFEGSRPFLIEMQALVASSLPPYVRRMAFGIEQNRLALLIAVLEKRRGILLTNCDVYLKVTGGLFLKDPAVDLAVIGAVFSSYKDKPLPSDMVFIGEVGLSGKIRQVPFIDARLKEAEKMGYKKAVIPAGLSFKPGFDPRMEIIQVGMLDEFIEVLMEGWG